MNFYSTMKQTMGTSFLVLAFLTWVVSGIYGTILCLRIITDHFGVIVAFISLIFFPAMHLVVPWYEGAVNSNWFPMQVVYGGFFCALVLAAISMTLHEFREHVFYSMVDNMHRGKTMSGATLFAILFGPVGLRYASASVGLLVIITSGIFAVLLEVDKFLVAWVVTIWLLSIVLSVLLVRNHNREPRGKSMSVAILLAFVFGPVGLIYAGRSVGYLMIISTFITMDFLGVNIVDIVGLSAIWLVNIPLSVLLVRHHNRKLQPQLSDQ